MFLSILNNLALFFALLLAFGRGIFGSGDEPLLITLIVLVSVLGILRLFTLLRDRFRIPNGLLLVLAAAYILLIVVVEQLSQLALLDVLLLLAVFGLASGLRRDTLLLRGIGLLALLTSLAMIGYTLLMPPPQTSEPLILNVAVFLVACGPLCLILAANKDLPIFERRGWALVLTLVGTGVVFSYEWFAIVLLLIGCLLVTGVYLREPQARLGFFLLLPAVVFAVLAINLRALDAVHVPEGDFVASLPVDEAAGLNLNSFTNQIVDSSATVRKDALDVTIGGVQRSAVVVQAEPARLSRVLYRIALPANAPAFVDFFIAQRGNPGPTWFGMDVAPIDENALALNEAGNNPAQDVFVYRHSPTVQELDRNWRRFTVDVSAYAGQEVQLSLLNWSASATAQQAVWGNVRVISTADAPVTATSSRPAALISNTVRPERFGFRTPIPNADLRLRLATWDEQWQSAQADLLLGTSFDMAIVEANPEASNDLLYILNERGVVGIGAYLVLLLVALLQGLLLRGKPRNLALGVIVLLMVAYGYWQVVTVLPALTLFFWLLLGLFVAPVEPIRRPRRQRTPEPEAETETPAPAPEQPRQRQRQAEPEPEPKPEPQRETDPERFAPPVPVLPAAAQADNDFRKFDASLTDAEPAQDESDAILAETERTDNAEADIDPYAYEGLLTADEVDVAAYDMAPVQEDAAADVRDAFLDDDSAYDEAIPYDDAPLTDDDFAAEVEAAWPDTFVDADGYEEPLQAEAQAPIDAPQELDPTEFLTEVDLQSDNLPDDLFDDYGAAEPDAEPADLSFLDAQDDLAADADDLDFLTEPEAVDDVDDLDFLDDPADVADAAPEEPPNYDAERDALFGDDTASEPPPEEPRPRFRRRPRE